MASASSRQSEITQKIKAAVAAKLKELGAHFDDDLPDYVIVMIANRKTRGEMTHKLKKFLGKSTASTFTKWLHKVLDLLRSLSASAQSLKTPPTEQSEEMAPSSSSSKKKKAAEEDKSSRRIKDEEKSRKKESEKRQSEKGKSDAKKHKIESTEKSEKRKDVKKEKKSVESKQDVKVAWKPQKKEEEGQGTPSKKVKLKRKVEMTSETISTSSQPKETVQEPEEELEDAVAKKPKLEGSQEEQPEPESHKEPEATAEEELFFPVPSTSPETKTKFTVTFGGLDALSIQRQFFNSPPPEEAEEGELEEEEGEEVVPEEGAEEPDADTDSLDPEDEEDEDLPAHPSFEISDDLFVCGLFGGDGLKEEESLLVDSTPSVGVKFSITLGAGDLEKFEQSFRAAETSTEQEEEAVEQQEFVLELNPLIEEELDLETAEEQKEEGEGEEGLESDHKQKKVMRVLPMVKGESLQDLHPLADDPGDKEQQNVEPSVEVPEAVEEVESVSESRAQECSEGGSTPPPTKQKHRRKRSRSSEKKSKRKKRSPSATHLNPLCMLSLEGVGQSLRERIVSRMNSRQTEQQQAPSTPESLTTVMEKASQVLQRCPPVKPISIDLEDEDEEEETEKQKPPKKQQCRFWPKCRLGPNCQQNHVSAPCRTFPNCRFGDRCLYTHPVCKFDGYCQRPACPYSHSSRSTVPSVFAPLPIACGQGRTCLKQSCPFDHPKKPPCKFGGVCSKWNCQFDHSSLAEKAPTVGQRPPRPLVDTSRFKLVRK